MGVYLLNVEMPRTHPITVEIYPNGKVLSKTVGRMDIHGEAVPVPPHGRLIDADALPWEKQGLLAADEDWALPCSIIENAPTIIEAEEGE